MGANRWKIKQKQNNKRKHRLSIYTKKHIRIREKIINKQKKIATFSNKIKKI